MDIVRNKLVELGFSLEKVGHELWPDYVYKWKHENYRDATYYVWITSYSNWYFKIEMAKSGHETGIMGFSRTTKFKGNISSKSALFDLEVLLRCTGVTPCIKGTTNQLL